MLQFPQDTSFLLQAPAHLPQDNPLLELEAVFHRAKCPKSYLKIPLGWAYESARPIPRCGWRRLRILLQSQRIHLRNSFSRVGHQVENCDFARKLRSSKGRPRETA